MGKNLVRAALLLLAAGATSVACSDDDDGKPTATGGSSDTAGKASTAGASGSATAGSSSGGKAGAAGSSNTAATAGETTTEAGNGGVPSAGAGGDAASAGEATGGAGGAGGAGSSYTPEMIARGTLIVRNIALCGGCHTATAGMELGGNPQFKGGALPAPNLTPDATGLGDWSDQQIIDAFRNGIDDEGRHLDPAMPYWLFHNMSDDDAMAVVAFLRSLPASSGAVGEANPEATAVTPLSPADFPAITLAETDPDYPTARQGRYLVSGVAQCVKCHSPSASGLPAKSYFSGVVPANNTTIFAPNITPDATGLAGWTADDIATALKAGTAKGGASLCGSMPSAAKGYGGMSDADAHAIGVYLTAIAPISKAAAAPSLEPACP